MSESNQLTVIPTTAPQARHHKSDPQNNPSVTKCWRAYRRTYRKELAVSDKYEAEREAKKAYLLDMPDLFGYENIRDFIACVGFAVIYDIVSNKEGDQFLAAARVALTAFDRQPKPNPKSPA